MLNKYLKLLIVGVFVVLVAVQANKSFVLDEIDFPTVSHATSMSGKPVYYRGETSPSHVGTYHPTLYINSLASFIKIFGFSGASVRFFGVLCILASAYMLLLILRSLAKSSPTAEILLLSLYLLNPYTIANATLPDIDSTILPVVVLSFIYLSIKYLLPRKDTSNRVIIILGSVFALALWSKLTTPLILPPFLAALTYIATKNTKQSIVFTLKVVVFGTVLFAVTYFAYCLLLGLSPTYTYGFLLDSFTKGTSSDGPLTGAVKNLNNIKYFVFWPTLPIIGLIGVSTLGVLLDKKNDNKTQVKKLLIVMALLVTFFYIALIAPFGGFFKYPFPVFGLAIMSIVFFYDRYLRDVKINKVHAVLAIGSGFILEKLIWSDSMFLNGKPFRGLLILLFIIAACYLLIRKTNSRYISSAFVLAILFSIGFQTSVSRVQATNEYPTKYLYGQLGMDQAADYLRSNIDPNEVIWAMKDIGYYVNNRYVESYSYYFDNSLQKDLISKLENGKIRYYVVTTGIGQDNIDYYVNIKQILDKYAVREKQYGNYVIYKAKE